MMEVHGGADLTLRMRSHAIRIKIGNLIDSCRVMA